MRGTDNIRFLCRAISAGERTDSKVSMQGDQLVRGLIVRFLCRVISW